jgi:hypothetical protein
MFNNWHKKEKPIQGMMGMGGGATGYLVSGAGGGQGLQIQRYNDLGSLIETIDLDAAQLQSGYDFDNIGYYNLTWSGEANVRCWVWGGAGGRGDAPGPSFGGAGGGARGEIVATDGAVWTVIVGGGGKGPGSQMPGTSYTTGSRGFPDGGTVYQYNGAGGGGSSRIATSQISYLQRDNAPNVWHLIGGGGGGNIGYTNNSGTIDGRGGGTDGMPGGGYYFADGAVFGRGASQGGGGSGGPSGRQPAGSAGAKYYGGPAPGNGGGAGGGGYYGGGGAGGYYGTGGGGSGYIHPSVTNSAFFLGASANRERPNDDPAYPQPKISNLQRATGSNYARGAGSTYPYLDANNRGFVRIQIVG